MPRRALPGGCWPGLRLLASGPMAAPLVSFLRELWQKYRQDHVSILVSSLAYYTFFSFFPMMLLLASIIGFLFGMGEEYARLPRTILGLLPFSSDYMTNAVDRIVHARRSLGFFGSVLLIWSSTAAFDILQQILNRIHRAPTMRPLWRRRLLGILLGLILLLFIPASIIMAGARPLLARVLARLTALPPSWEPAVLTLCTGALAILFNFTLFLTLYLFGHSVRRRTREIWVGALTGAVLWEASKALFGLYVRSLRSEERRVGREGG